MKKLLSSGLAAVGLLAGCTQSEATAQGAGETTPAKTAVVYFSWSPDGNTRFAAGAIAKKTGADLFEIKAETPYSSDFKACCDEAQPECYGKALRPILPVEGLDLAKYDVVLVGTPNWWGTMAPPVRTFVAQNLEAFKGKRTAIFATHGGGGMQRIGKEFEELVGGTADVLPPGAFPGASIKNSVSAIEAFAKERTSNETSK